MDFILLLMCDVACRAMISEPNFPVEGTVFIRCLYLPERIAMLLVYSVETRPLTGPGFELVDWSLGQQALMNSIVTGRLTH